MSSISGVGGGGGWAAYGPPDASAMKQRMFNKADGDGSGGIDATELKQALAKLSEHTGQDVGDADDLMTKWDSDGDGSLNADEMDTGMKSLMPQPSSTMDFAQQRAGMDGGMPPPPPPPDDSEEDEDSSTSSTSSTSSSSRSAALELQKLVQSLTQAMDSDGDSNISADEVSGFLSQLSQRVDTTA